VYDHGGGHADHVRVRGYDYGQFHGVHVRVRIHGHDRDYGRFQNGRGRESGTTAVGPVAARSVGDGDVAHACDLVLLRGILGPCLSLYRDHGCDRGRDRGRDHGHDHGRDDVVDDSLVHDNVGEADHCDLGQ